MRVARAHEAGVTIAQIAKDFGVHEMPMHTWIRQALIDEGDKPGKTTTESAQLREANRRARLRNKKMRSYPAQRRTCPRRTCRRVTPAKGRNREGRRSSQPCRATGCRVQDATLAARRSEPRRRGRSARPITRGKDLQSHVIGRGPVAALRTPRDGGRLAKELSGLVAGEVFRDRDAHDLCGGAPLVSGEMVHVVTQRLGEANLAAGGVLPSTCGRV